MASNGLPEGWSFEPEDRSVGIFGDAFVHEDCPKASDPDTTGEAEQRWDALTLILTCGDCGAVVELEQDEPDPEPYWDQMYAPEKY
jgi:hypothetical protein